MTVDPATAAPDAPIPAGDAPPPDGGRGVARRRRPDLRGAVRAVPRHVHRVGAVPDLDPGGRDRESAAGDGGTNRDRISGGSRRGRSWRGPSGSCCASPVGPAPISSRSRTGGSCCCRSRRSARPACTCSARGSTPSRTQSGSLGRRNEYVGQHRRGGQPPGERVLLTDVIAPVQVQGGSTVRRCSRQLDVRAVPESRARTRDHPAGVGENRQQCLPSETTEHDHRAQGRGSAMSVPDPASGGTCRARRSSAGSRAVHSAPVT